MHLMKVNLQIKYYYVIQTVIIMNCYYKGRTERYI